MSEKTPVQGGATEEQIEAAARVGVHPPTGHVWVERDGRVLAHVYDVRDAEEIVRALSASASAHAADEHHDAKDDNLPAAFEQMREEYDAYRNRVRLGLQRVRDIAARSSATTPPEVLDALLDVGRRSAPPTNPADEHHDAEEREAECQCYGADGVTDPKCPACQAEPEDHAATVTGDRDSLATLLGDLRHDPELHMMYQRYPLSWALTMALRIRVHLSGSVEVDEAKLAEVIEQVIDGMRAERRLYPDVYAADVAHAVAEHLRGEGR